MPKWAACSRCSGVSKCSPGHMHGGRVGLGALRHHSDSGKWKSYGPFFSSGGSTKLCLGGGEGFSTRGFGHATGCSTRAVRARAPPRGR